MEKQLRVLHLEDNATDAELIRRKLAQEGFACEVTRAVTREEYCACAQKGSIDLILCDYTLPAFDGPSALAIARERCPEVPFIFVSGTIGEDRATESLRMGATDYVLKDKLSGLGPAIRRALREAEDRRGRKQAEEALRKSEERYRVLFETSPDVIVLLDTGLRIVMVNKTVVTQYGYESIQGLIGKNAADLVVPEDRQRVVENFSRRLIAGNGRNTEYRFLKRDGGFFYGELSSSVLRDEKGTATSVIAVIRDITERKQAGEEQHRLASLIENSSDFIGMAGLDGNMIYLNGAGRELVGLGRDIDVRSTSFTDYFMADDVPILQEHLVRDETWRGDFRVRNAGTGSPVPVELYGFYIKDEKTGERLFRAAVIRDITERKRVEQALLEGEQRFKHLVESVTDYIYTVKVENGRAISTEHGPGCVNVTGYRPEEYRDDPDLWLRMVNPEDRQAVVAQAESILQGKTARPLEHRITHKDGSVRWVRNTPVPRYDGRAVLITYDGLISDVTDRKKLEDQLRQAQKMEAIGQLSGGIAHDFNNILSAIVGYGHILHLKMQEDDPLRMNVEHILESAERAANLTRSLLAFSRKQIINLENVDLHEILQRMEKFLRRIIGEDIELRTKFVKNPLTVHVDSRQVEQVLMNLATNARDAMPLGGSITIETDAYRLDERFIKAHGYGAEGWYARISVTDTGIGMDPRTQKRIFEPFFTTKELGKGTGLGLSVVYGILKQHNGFINVYSEPGRGAIFKLYFPLVQGHVGERRPAAVNRIQELPQGSETVLVAEDDDSLRKLSSAVLTEFGYRVIEAANGEEAVNQYVLHQDAIRLLILDMIMPKKNGKEVYEEIRKLRADIKVIFTSGYTADKIFDEGRGKDVELLLKPVSPRDLLIKVREILDKDKR